MKKHLALFAVFSVLLTACTSVKDDTSMPGADDSELEVIIEQPGEDEVVTAPFAISGKARGYWFSEGQITVKVTDMDGETLFTGDFESSEWMTEDFVPFEVLVTSLDTEGLSSGMIVVEKANPSGLPENDDSFKQSISF